MGGVLDILGFNYFLGFIGLEMVPTQRSNVKKRSTRTRRQGSESEDEEELQFKDLDFARYNSELDADFSPSELSGEDDPLEYDSQTEEPEPRFAEVAEAEVLEGDAGAAEDVQIHAEDYNGEGEKIAVSAKADEKVKTDEKVAVGAITEPAKTDKKITIDEKVAVDAKTKPTKIDEKMVVDGKTEPAKVNEKVAVKAKTAEPAIDSKTTAP